MPRPKGRSPKTVLTVTLAPDVKMDVAHLRATWGMPQNDVITLLLQHALYGVPTPVVASRPDAGSFEPGAERVLTTTIVPSAKHSLERLAVAWRMNQNEVVTRLVHHVLYGVPLPPLPVHDAPVEPPVEDRDGTKSTGDDSYGLS